MKVNQSRSGEGSRYSGAGWSNIGGFPMGHYAMVKDRANESRILLTLSFARASFRHKSPSTIRIQTVRGDGPRDGPDPPDLQGQAKGAGRAIRNYKPPAWERVGWITWIGPRFCRYGRTGYCH